MKPGHMRETLELIVHGVRSMGSACFINAKHLTCGLALAATLVVTAARADMIVTPKAVTGNVAPNAGSSYASLVNSSGLTFAVTSGMDVASALLAKESTVVADKYVTPASGTNYFDAGTIPVLTFDLGSTAYNVSSIVLWNYQVSVNNVTEFSLDFYSDAAATVQIGSTISGLTALAITTNAQQVTFSGVYGVRAIKLTMTDNNGGNRVGLGEVRFAGTPAPSAVIIKPSAISSTQGSANSSSPGALLDNSGLSSPVDAESDTLDALSVTHSFPTFPVLDTLYLNSGSGDYTLTFTLGAAYDDVNSIVVWNYPYPAPQHSTRYFDLSFYSDTGATVQVGSTLTGLFLETSGSEPEPAQQVYFPGGIEFDSVRVIKMTCTNSWGDTNKRALGEVRFGRIGSSTVDYWDAYISQITNGLTGYQDDAEGDGYANLLEYVTGGNPTNSDTVAHMNGGQSNGFLQIRFTRDTNAVDATLIVEGSSSVSNDTTWIGINTNSAGSWSSPASVTESGVNPVNVTVSDTETGATRNLRLRVTRP